MKQTDMTSPAAAKLCTRQSHKRHNGKRGHDKRLNQSTFFEGKIPLLRLRVPCARSLYFPHFLGRRLPVVILSKDTSRNKKLAPAAYLPCCR
jgi:hypothetical protein